eukprot:jgi/Tetstr1/424594/TSEL_015119.t1
MPLSKELFATARRVAGEAAEDPDAGSGSGPDLANPLNFMLWKFLRHMQEATRSGGAGGAVGADFSAGDNICVTFGHAVQSVRGCPWRVYDAQAAQELNGIGSWLAKQIKQLFDEYPQDPPTEEELVAVAAAKKAAKAAKAQTAKAKAKAKATSQKRAAPVPDAGPSLSQRDPNVPSPGSDDEAAPKRSKKTPKAKKPYRPKTGTANYAFMIVMYKEQMAGAKHFGKAELMAKAQASNLASSSIYGVENPGAAFRNGASGHYNGWSCLVGASGLNKKDPPLVTIWSNPLKIKLTEDGIALAAELYQEALAAGNIAPLSPRTAAAAACRAAPAGPPHAAAAPVRTAAHGAGASGLSPSIIPAPCRSGSQEASARRPWTGLRARRYLASLFSWPTGGGGRGGGYGCMPIPAYSQADRSQAQPAHSSQAAAAATAETAGDDDDEVICIDDSSDDEGAGTPLAPARANSAAMPPRESRLGGAPSSQPDDRHPGSGAAPAPRPPYVPMYQRLLQQQLLSQGDSQERLGSLPGSQVRGEDAPFAFKLKCVTSEAKHADSASCLHIRSPESGPEFSHGHALQETGRSRSSQFEDGYRQRGDWRLESMPAAAGSLRALRSPPIPPGRSFADVYEVCLIVDQREQFTNHVHGHGRMQKTEALAHHLTRIQTSLSHQGYAVNMETRQVIAGDAIWVARSRRNPREEYVLDCILERKSVEDLSCSIKSGRHEQQKFYMKKSGLRMLYYLVEGHPDQLATPASQKAVKTASVQNEIIHGYRVLRTGCPQETFSLLGQLTRCIATMYSTLGSKPAGYPAELPTYTAFVEQVTVSKTLTVKDVWGKMLSVVKGVGPNAVEGILNAYPTPMSLFKEYEKVKARARASGQEPEKAAREMLSTLRMNASSARGVGPSASHQIYDTLFHAMP